MGSMTEARGIHTLTYYSENKVYPQAHANSSASTSLTHKPYCRLQLEELARRQTGHAQNLKRNIKEEKEDKPEEKMVNPSPRERQERRC